MITATGETGFFPKPCNFKIPMVLEKPCDSCDFYNSPSAIGVLND